MSTSDVKMQGMNNFKFAPKLVSTGSQKLAITFANEVAQHRINQIEAVLLQVSQQEITPVDALFKIRTLSGISS